MGQERPTIEKMNSHNRKIFKPFSEKISSNEAIKKKDVQKMLKEQLDIGSKKKDEIEILIKKKKEVNYFFIFIKFESNTKKSNR